MKYESFIEAEIQKMHFDRPYGPLKATIKGSTSICLPVLNVMLTGWAVVYSREFKDLTVTNQFECTLLKGGI